MMEQRFIDWISKNRSLLEDLGFHISISRTSDLLDNSVTLNGESDLIIFQIIVWESGGVEVDAMIIGDDQSSPINTASETLSLEEKLDYYVTEIASLAQI